MASTAGPEACCVINLTTGAITTEDTLPKYKPFIGGMGLGYKVIWDEVPLDSDPLGPAAKAVFAVGPLTASACPAPAAPTSPFSPAGPRANPSSTRTWAATSRMRSSIPAMTP